MKYYSEKLNKLFESEKDLMLAEKEFEEKSRNAENELKIKKQMAQDIESAYKEYVNTVKESNKKISDANNKYLKLRSEFVRKYGSFHMSFRSNDSGESMTFVSDLIDLLFK